MPWDFNSARKLFTSCNACSSLTSNSSAIKVFGLLDGENSVEQIASMVAEEFEVSEEQALQDVNSFLAELKSHGMLV